MASLAATAVAPYPGIGPSATALPPSEWFPCGTSNRSIIARRLLLTLTGQGGLTNTIPAAALGVQDILEVSNLWDATNGKGYPAAVDMVNNTVVLLDGSAAPAPVDVTTTAGYITVIGTSRNVSSF